METFALIKTDPIPWRGIRAIEKLLLLALPLMAVSVLALSFLDEALLRRLGRMSGSGSILSWLANGYNAWLAFAGFLLLFILLLLWIRRRIRNDRRLWISSGCPNCNERDLVRVKRHTSDRFYGLIGVPAFRYACRNCTWRDLRVAQRESSPEREMEREEALFRFDPDGPAPAQAENVNGIPEFVDFELPEIAIFSEMRETDYFPEERSEVSDKETADRERPESQSPSSPSLNDDADTAPLNEDTTIDPFDESFWIWESDSDQ